MTISKKTGTFSTNKSFASPILTFLASGFGLGFIPIAPGTFGSLPGIGLFLLTRQWSVWIQVILLVLLIIAAIGLAEYEEKRVRKTDPSFVVIDEIVGMWATLFLIWRADIFVIFLGFLLFRGLDIFKIFPIRLFENFKGGMGIVMDDLAAGMIANILLRTLLLLIFQ